MNIKKGDTVQIIAGKDKGKQGKVLKSLPKDTRVIVEGINIVKLHKKPSMVSEGGIVEEERSIHASNVKKI